MRVVLHACSVVGVSLMRLSATVEVGHLLWLLHKSLFSCPPATPLKPSGDPQEAWSSPKKSVISTLVIFVNCDNSQQE